MDATDTVTDKVVVTVTVPGDADVAEFAMSPDGTELAVADSNVYVWRISR